MVLMGLSLSLFYYLVIDSVFLTASGLSIIIIGSTSIGLAYVRPHFPKGELRKYIVRARNLLLVILSVEFIIIIGLLAFFKQNDLSIYLIISIIVYLVTVWIYNVINPKLGNALTVVGAIAFVVLLGIIWFKIIDIIRS